MEMKIRDEFVEGICRIVLEKSVENSLLFDPNTNTNSRLLSSQKNPDSAQTTWDQSKFVRIEEEQKAGKVNKFMGNSRQEGSKARRSSVSSLHSNTNLETRGSFYDIIQTGDGFQALQQFYIAETALTGGNIEIAQDASSNTLERGGPNELVPGHNNQELNLISFNDSFEGEEGKKQPPAMRDAGAKPPQLVSPGGIYSSTLRSTGGLPQIDEYGLLKLLEKVLLGVNEFAVFQIFDIVDARCTGSISFEEFYILLFIFAAKEASGLVHALYLHAHRVWSLLGGGQEYISGDRMLSIGHSLGFSPTLLDDHAAMLGFSYNSIINFTDFNVYYFSVFTSLQDEAPLEVLGSRSVLEERRASVGVQRIGKGKSSCCGGGAVCRIL